MELLSCLTRVFRVASQNPGLSCVSLHITSLNDALTCIREMSWISCRYTSLHSFHPFGFFMHHRFVWDFGCILTGHFVTKRPDALYTDLRDLPDGTIWEINRTRDGPDDLQVNATGSQSLVLEHRGIFGHADCHEVGYSKYDDRDVSYMSTCMITYYEAYLPPPRPLLY